MATTTVATVTTTGENNMITIITFLHFNEICVSGSVCPNDMQKIKNIKKTMSSDEYAGYSPSEQNKYKAIEKITSKYGKPKVIRM